MPQYTLTYSEEAEGWTSFHSYMPENMLGMNNKFFTFRGGNLFVHHSETENRNTFYGVQYPTRISAMINDYPSDIKILQAVSLEGNAAWSVVLTSYISSLEDFSRTSISNIEFEKKEGKWYAYARRNEVSSDFSSRATYGIGRISSVTGAGLILTLSAPLPVSVRVGDDILNTAGIVVANIVNILSNNVLQIAFPSGLNVGDYILGRKSLKLEGAELRGYTTRVDLEVTSNDKRELFAVNTEVKKSFAS